MGFRLRLLRQALGLSLLALMLAHAIHVAPIDFVDRLDAIIYDARLRLTMPGGIDERIVIVDIDQSSLATVGRWPWSRDRLAELVSKVFESYGATLLGLDMILAEADDSSGLKALEGLAAGTLSDDARFIEELERLRPQLDHDRRLAAALARHPVVLSYVLTHGGRSSGELPPPVLTAPQIPGGRLSLAMWDSHGGNRPEFQRAARGAGYNNGIPDFDGLSRRVPLLASQGGAYYEALSLAMARALTGNPTPRPVFAAAGDPVLEAIELPTARGTVRIPVDANGMALIPYRGPQGSFRYWSAADVLAQHLPADALRGKIVLLGTTAPGLLDLRATPLDGAYPGVEVHANLLSGILDGRLKQQPAYAPGAQATLLLLLGLFLVFLLPRNSPLRASASVAAVLLLLAASNLALWQYASLALPLAPALLLTLMLYAVQMALGYIFEARTRRGMAKLFGQYVPPELVAQMSRNPERYSMAGQSRELTVLFADIRGFTTVSEGLTPGDLARMMNAFFTAMTGVIRAHRGTLDKYIGDAIMAFWGAPVDDPDHARHAVAAACGMQAALAEVNRALADHGWPRIAIGVGLNTGVMTVGDMGSHHRKAYTVIGDAVNLGSRLEGLTAYYGVGIVIGEAARRAVPDIACRELDRVQVKGRTGAVAIFEPLCPATGQSMPNAAELALWSEALARYRAKDWDAADAVLQRLTLADPASRLYERYRERIALLREHPPGEDWDGVWRFDAK